MDQWLLEIKQPGGDVSLPYSAATPDGGLIFTAAHSQADVRILARADAAGTILWRKSIIGNGAGIATNATHAVFFGYTGNAVVKIDLATGAIVWAKAIAGITAQADFTLPGFLAIDAAGDVYLYGYNYSTFVRPLLKFASADGAILWQRDMKDTGTSSAPYSALALDSSGNLAVLLSTSTTPVLHKVASADGSILWSRLIDNPGTNRRAAISTDSSGNFYVACASSTDNRIPVVKFDTSGSVLWNIDVVLATLSFAYPISSTAGPEGVFIAVFQENDAPPSNNILRINPAGTAVAIVSHRSAVAPGYEVSGAPTLAGGALFIADLSYGPGAADVYSAFYRQDPAEFNAGTYGTAASRLVPDSVSIEAGTAITSTASLTFPAAPTFAVTTASTTFGTETLTTLLTPLDVFAVTDSSTANINAPAGIAVANFGAQGVPVAPMGVAVANFAAQLIANAPAGAVQATAHDSTGENAANIMAPMATLSGYLGMGARVTAPKPTVSASGTTQNWLKATAVAPAGLVAASATFSESSKGGATAPMATLVGYGGMVASVTLTGSPALQASVTTGGVASTGIVGPMATLDLFEVTTEAFSTANIIAPMGEMGRTLQAWVLAPMARLDAVGTAVVAATYEAYAVNMLHRNTDTPVDEVTRYTNFPFTHVVRYKNSYYGANSTGLYLLEGTTDDGAPIPWEFKTTITDFESPMGKTAVSAYFAGRMGPAATVGIHLGESGDVSYSHSTPRGPAAQNYRQVFGLGLKSRYYALSVAGEGVMELDAVEFNTKTLTRRI